MIFAAPAWPQERATLPQRTVADANNFLNVLTSEGGSLLKFDVQGTYAYVDVTAHSAPTPCVTRLTFAPQNVFWDTYPPAKPDYKPPQYIDINWETTKAAKAYGLYRPQRDARPGKELWGLQLGLGSPNDLGTNRYVYWVFVIAAEKAQRIVAVTEFLREKCQFNTDTGF